MSDKLVSILIPVHNQEKYIGRCLRSLLSQTMHKDKFEIIVVNDGSIDRTSYALELFKEDITLIVNHKKLGLPASLNIAIKKVKTKYFVRVDSDDYVNNKFLELMCLYLSENQNIDALTCDYYIVDNSEKILSRKNSILNPIACGILFETDHIFEIGGYNEEFFYNEEKEMRTRFEEKYSIERLKLPLYRYRKHDTNMTNDKEKMEYYNNKLLKT